MDLETKHIHYIESTLVSNILRDERFVYYTLKSCVVITNASKLDGFMSSIYQVELQFVNIKDESKSSHKIVVKLMKGEDSFRLTSCSYVQFANEIYMYNQVIPTFAKMLHSSPSLISLDDMIPKLYYGFFGHVPELGPLRESVLALQNLGPVGFRGGPQLILDEAHLRLMVHRIAQFHSLSYALKILNPSSFYKLVSGVEPMHLLPSGLPGDTVNAYTLLYGIGFNRFLAYVRRTSDNRSDKFLKDVDNLERRFAKNPVTWLERKRRDANDFTVIQHGDYNRNNVLFKYSEKSIHSVSTDDSNFDSPQDIRMLDFQQTRIGSPVFDLSFFMYMNSDSKTRHIIWDDLLAYYHETLIESVASILGCNISDHRLKPYSFDRFSTHFSQFAFAGALVCLHFTPWMICPEEDCRRVDHLFTEDMHSREFYDLSMTIGGDEADERIAEMVQHASEKGYLQWINDEESITFC